mmetsp:Transcript_15875/g.47773  ORF Transcript_15875/g.47773 Transcript_15875/m.47773 type:complete len:412 (+) Transcript_15875:1024-2259(+)
MDELAELVHLREVPTVQQLLDPVGGLLADGEGQLDLQHGVGEARHLRARQRQRWVPPPPAGVVAGGAVVGVLLEHGQVGVQTDAHRRVERNLESSALVLGAGHGAQLLAVHRFLALAEELRERLLLCLAPLLFVQVGEGVLQGVGALQEGDHLGLLQHHPLLHRLFPLPPFAVGFALHEDQLGHGAVPPQPQGDRLGGLVQPPVVQLHAVVVQVHAVDQLPVLHVARIRGVEREDGEVLQDVVLHGTHVRGAHPVLGRRPHEALSGVLVLDTRLVPAQQAVDVRQAHQDVAGGSLDPLLLVQMGNVELLAGRMRQHLVVLLQDLMEPHVVQVHILLQSQVLIPQLLGLLLQMVLLGSAGVSAAGLLVQTVQPYLQAAHAALREVAHLFYLSIEGTEETLLGCVPLSLGSRH